METMAVSDQSATPREEPRPSTSSDSVSSLLNKSTYKTNVAAVKPTKRPKELPPLRNEATKTTFQSIHPRPVQPVNISIPIQMNMKPLLRYEVTPEPEEVYDEDRLRKRYKPKTWRDWVSFKLEHFYTSLRFQMDSDYDGPAPVPSESGFKRYFCARGKTTLKSVRQMLNEKFCKEKKYRIHFIHPKARSEELCDDVTLDALAAEANWHGKRPLRILFTLIPPKEPPPALEKEPMPILVEKPELKIDEDDDIQIIESRTNAQTTPPNLQRVPIPLQLTPQYAQIMPNLISRGIPMKRKMDPPETTPPGQMQQIVMNQIQRFNPQNLTAEQIRALQQTHQQNQQMVAVSRASFSTTSFQPIEYKQMRIVNALAANMPQSPSLFPVQIVSNNQMKAPTMVQQQPPQQQNAAILHKLLLQQQQKKMKEVQQVQMQQQQQAQAEQNRLEIQRIQAIQAQIRNQHVQLQAQVMATTQRAQMVKDTGPPPTKKMAIQEALESPFRLPAVSHTQTMTTPSTDNQKHAFHVPSPPSPPKPQTTVATPSPPAISPIPPKINPSKLKPFLAQVSTHPITNTKPVSPPPSLSPVNSNSIDLGTMAKMKNQSLGRTFKETFAKTTRPSQSQLIDGIRAQNVNGEITITAPSSLLLNSKIVPSL